MRSLILLAPILGMALTGCSGVGFSASKESALAKSSVFETNVPTNGGSANSNSSSSDGRPVKTPNALDTLDFTQLPVPAACTFAQREAGICEVDETTYVNPVNYEGTTPPRIVRECHNNQSRESVNMKRAMYSNLPVELVIDKKVCTTNATAIANLVKKGSITKADLMALCPSIVPASATAVDTHIYVNGVAYEGGDRGQGKNGSGSKSLSVLWALGSSTQLSNLIDKNDEYCDDSASPLVIHMASDIKNPVPVALSSQEDGIQFDLLGAISNHQAVQISWFTNSDYRMLALPDSNGEVHGIDQLFGDNTFGPDARNPFATDGYAALAKHDDNHDGLIDSQDAVFSQLRLWLDSDFDGRGRAHEMVSLSQARIAYIDLVYSTDYAEKDQYGNETKMKSVVGYEDGRLDLIFDLWFSH